MARFFLASLVATGLVSVVACTNAEVGIEWADLGDAGSASRGTDGGAAVSVDACRSFVATSNACMQSLGKQASFTDAACARLVQDPAQALAISCVVEQPTGYCKAVSGATHDPEYVKYASCMTAGATTGACSEAIRTFAACGVLYSYAKCEGSVAAMAECVLAEPRGACEVATRGGQALSSDGQRYLACTQNAYLARADAGRD